MSIKDMGFCNLSRAIASTLVLLELGDEFGFSHGGFKILTNMNRAMHRVGRHCSGKGEEDWSAICEAIPGDEPLGSEVPAAPSINCGEELKLGAGA